MQFFPRPIHSAYSPCSRTAYTQNDRLSAQHTHTTHTRTHTDYVYDKKLNIKWSYLWLAEASQEGSTVEPALAREGAGDWTWKIRTTRAFNVGNEQTFETNRYMQILSVGYTHNGPVYTHGMHVMLCLQWIAFNISMYSCFCCWRCLAPVRVPGGGGGSGDAVTVVFKIKWHKWHNALLAHSAVCHPFWARENRASPATYLFNIM